MSGSVQSFRRNQPCRCHWHPPDNRELRRCGNPVLAAAITPPRNYPMSTATLVLLYLVGCVVSWVEGRAIRVRVALINKSTVVDWYKPPKRPGMICHSGFQK